MQLLVNGIEQHQEFITLKDDAAEYDVRVIFSQKLIDKPVYEFTGD